MSERPTKVIYDLSSNTETVIEMTDEEIAEMEARRAEYIAQVQAEEEKNNEILALKNSAKAKLIAGQPLTAEEAEVLVF